MPDFIQRSFGSGEISPILRSRADLERYSTGLALCKNFIIQAQGGAFSRPGLRFVGEINDSSKRARLIPFSFNTTQNYILVFEHLTMMVVKDAAFVLDSASLPDLYILATPFTEAQLPRLIFTQDADVMTITHQDHHPKILTRLNHDEWVLDDIDYAAVVAPPGALTLAAAGTLSGGDPKNYTYVVTAVDQYDVESLPSPANTITTDELSNTGGVHIDWADVPDTAYYRIYKDPSDSTNVFGHIGDSLTSEFTDFNFFADLSDAPPADYLPFTVVTQQPATVGYYQQRQIFANSVLFPQTVVTTQSGVYNSLRRSDPPRDNDGLTFTIKDRQVNEIRHILSLDGLILLTSGGEWIISEGADQVLKPDTIGGRIFSRWGSSWVPPALVGDSALFVQEKGGKLRDLFYKADKGDKQLSSTDLSFTAEHLTADYTIQEMAYAPEPYSINWMIRDDGLLLGVTYQQEYGVTAWHQHNTGASGLFESVAVIGEDGRDALYVIVKRTIDGSVVRYVERMEYRDVSSAQDAFCVDSGLTYSGAATVDITGLDHLEGEEVTVLADGCVVTGLVVEAGAIELPRASTLVHVGLPYTPTLRTLDIDINAMAETLKGRDIDVTRVTVEVFKSRGGWIATVDDFGVVGAFEEIAPRFQSDGYDPIALKSYKAEVAQANGYSKAGSIQIEQRAPLPLAILSVIPNINVS